MGYGVQMVFIDGGNELAHERQQVANPGTGREGSQEDE